MTKKSDFKKNGSKRSVLGLSALAGAAFSFAGAGAAEAQEVEPPEGYQNITDLEGVLTVEQQPDGSVLVTFEDGRQVAFAQEDVLVVGTEVFVTEASLDGAGVGILDMVAANPVPVLLAGSALGVGALAAGGGGNSDSNQAPGFSSASSVSVSENTSSVFQVVAQDPNGDPVSYTISGGADAGLFEVDPSTGQLSFIAPPDFEAPADADGDNQYELIVTASDGTASTSQTITVTVSNENDNSPSFTSESATGVQENGVAAILVTAEDLDGDTITFSITGGADASLFVIDPSTGQLSFNSAPDFEAPGDSDADNVYRVEVTASDGTNSTVQMISLTVLDVVNENLPVFTSGAAISSDENSAAAFTAAASDGDGDALTFSISGGADAALFAIDPVSGAVTFLNSPDFEAPADANADNVYELELSVSDGAAITTQTVSITVTNLNDNQPVITSAATVSLTENSALNYDVSATDSDGGSLTYSISGGVDAALFGIDPNTGAVSFLASPDFEAPGDSDADNVYDIEVSVSDGVNTTTQPVSITVTNVNDVAPVFTSGGTASAPENQTAAYAAVAGDAEGDAVTYSLSGGTDASLFSIDPTTGVVSFLTAPDFEAPGDSDADNVYDIEVTASDGTNSTTQTVAVTVTDVNDNAPVFTSGASASAAENQTAAYTATATDPNGDTVTYAISGGADASLFNIDPNTGAVTFINAPNFEAPGDANADNVYDVEISANDGVNTTTQTVAISVNDENDAPVFSLATTTFSENSTVISVINVTDEDGTTFSQSDFAITGGPDSGAGFLFFGSSGGSVSFVRTGLNFEAPVDANADNTYEVELTLTDGSVSTSQIVSVTITDVDEAPSIASGATGIISENSAAGAYTAVGVDPEGGVVTYSIVGGADAALFNIDPNSGVVSFISAPDHENPVDSNSDNIYGIQVGFSDGTTPTTTANISITVSDENDNSPAFTSPASFVIEDDQLAAFDVIATDADVTSILTYSISGGADGALFTVDPGTGAVSFLSAPDALSPGDANADNIYEVEVSVSDGINTASQLNTVEVYDPAPSVGAMGLTPTQGFIVQGDTLFDQAGTQVASLGDVNGDGFEDFALSAPDGDDGGNRAGEVYVIFGGSGVIGNLVSGRQVVDLSDLSASEGFIIQGDVGTDELEAVSSAGDVNGDGIDDIFVGSQLADGGGGLNGEGYVIFGSAGTFGSSVTTGGAARQVVDLTTLAPSQGFVIFGDMGNDRAATNVSVIGDINGDGFDDLALTAPSGDDGGGAAGEAYIVFGSDAGFGTPVTASGNTRQVIDLTSIDPSEGFIVQGDQGGDFLFSVSSLGDVNGDGFDDFVVGATGGDDGGGNAGEAYVIFGTSSGFGALTGGRNVLDLTMLSAAEGFIIQGDEGGDQLGASVNGAGDVNGDGFDDIIVGANRGTDGGTDAGEAYVIYGGSTAFGVAVTTGGATRQVLDVTTLSPTQGFVVQGISGSATGNAVASGDLNGDGYADVVIGAPDRDFDAPGDAYILFGSASAPGDLVSGRQVVDLEQFESSDGFVLSGDAIGDGFGIGVAIADVNGDGFDDVIVGAPGGDDGGATAGEAYVVFGGQFQVGPNASLTLTGTSGVDMLIGNIGNDAIAGNGGADVIRGGGGDDSISISDTGFADVEGGSGQDTLSLAGAGLALDLTSSGTAPIASIEIIDISGSGNNSITVDAQAVFDLTEERSNGETIIRIDGDTGDVVNANGFSANGTITINSTSYNVFEDGNAIIQVQSGVTVNTGGSTSSKPQPEPLSVLSNSDDEQDQYFDTEAWLSDFAVLQAAYDVPAIEMTADLLTISGAGLQLIDV